MSGADRIPDELVWTAEGHLTDVAMTSIADGEDAIVPLEAFAHLGGCEACAVGVESAAALSARVGDALSAAAVEPWRFPVKSVIAALALSALFAAPKLGALKAWVSALYGLFVDGLPFLARSATALFRVAAPWAPVISVCSAALLMMVGLSVARSSPRMVQR